MNYLYFYKQILNNYNYLYLIINILKISKEIVFLIYHFKYYFSYIEKKGLIHELFS